MLRAYFDESGTHSSSLVTSIGGYVGTEAAWTAIEQPWLDVLAEFADRGVKFFHMSEALAQVGQFSRIDKPTLNYIVTQLSQLLGRTAGLQAISCAVVVENWLEQVSDVEFLARFPEPIDLCFDSVVRQLWEWAHKKARGERVVPMFAYSPQYTERMARIGRMYGAQEWYRHILGPIAFGYPDQLVPLQAADLLAHQMNDDVVRRAYETPDLAHGGRTKALHWASGGRFVWGNWFDGPALRMTVARFKKTGEIYSLP